MSQETSKSTISLSFDILPDSRHWAVNSVYRVKLALRQVGLSEEDATFEVVDASSLEPDDKAKKRFLTTEGGYLM